METIKINTYQFSELSEEAKKTAFKNWLETQDEFLESYDFLDTLKRFAEEFNLTLKDWSLGQCQSYINFESNLEHTDVIGFRLHKFLLNNYFSILFKPEYKGCLKTKTFVRHARIKSMKNLKGTYFNPYYSAITKNTDYNLTGTYCDKFILNPIYEFLNKPTNITLLDLIEECINSFIKGYEEEYNYVLSYEYFVGEEEANPTTYLSDGRVFRY